MAEIRVRQTSPMSLDGSDSSSDDSTAQSTPPPTKTSQEADRSTSSGQYDFWLKFYYKEMPGQAQDMAPQQPNRVLITRHRPQEDNTEPEDFGMVRLSLDEESSTHPPVDVSHASGPGTHTFNNSKTEEFSNQPQIQPISSQDLTGIAPSEVIKNQLHIPQSQTKQGKAEHTRNLKPRYRCVGFAWAFPSDFKLPEDHPNPEMNHSLTSDALVNLKRGRSEEPEAQQNQPMLLANHPDQSFDPSEESTVDQSHGSDTHSNEVPNKRHRVEVKCQDDHDGKVAQKCHNFTGWFCQQRVRHPSGIYEECKLIEIDLMDSDPYDDFIKVYRCTGCFDKYRDRLESTRMVYKDTSGMRLRIFACTVCHHTLCANCCGYNRAIKFRLPRPGQSTKASVR